MQGSTTVDVVLYKSKTLSNGEHPLMIRITKERKAAYKSLGYSCPAKHWDFEKNAPRKNHPQRELLIIIIRKAIEEYQTKVYELAADEKEFTSSSLLDEATKKSSPKTVFKFFEMTIKGFKENGQLGSENNYKHTLSCLRQYRSNKDLNFSSLDKDFLESFEKYLRKRGQADTTLSIAFRNIRSVYNMAISAGSASKKLYPFDEFKISKFNTETQKRAISKAEAKKIESIEVAENSNLFLARQVFLFCYYGWGMNFKDIALMKWENLIGNRVYYKRAKTGKLYNFALNETIQEIIEYYRPVTGNEPDNYIFNILDKERHKTPQQVFNRVKKVLRQVNTALKELGQIAEIDTPLTTYVARHTFATVLKKSGVDVAKISEMMGHDSIQTTKIYLDSFGNEELDQAALNLL